jgi:hypothetical protein
MNSLRSDPEAECECVRRIASEPAFHYWNGVLPSRKYYNAIALSRIFFLPALRFDGPFPTFFTEPRVKLLFHQ